MAVTGITVVMFAGCCVQLHMYDSAVEWCFVVVVARLRNNQWSKLVTDCLVGQQFHVFGERLRSVYFGVYRNHDTKKAWYFGCIFL